MQTIATRQHEMQPDDYFDAARGPKIHTETILVTPDLARAWLKRNVVNRKLSQSYVDKVAWDIRCGKWDYTHLSIGFSTRDELLDGQHRLNAIVKAGVAVEMCVSFNVPAEYGAAIDVGRSRSAADILHRSTRDTAICSALILLEAGGHRSSVRKIEETYDEHRRGIEWARKALPMQRGVTASLVAGFVYALPAAERDVIEFANSFIHFQGTKTTDPVVALRRYVESPRRAAAARLDASLAALRCLQAHCEKESVTRLFITEQGFEYFTALRSR